MCERPLANANYFVGTTTTQLKNSVNIYVFNLKEICPVVFEHK